MITIEKSIPLKKVETSGRPAKYPFAKMEVGDSIFIPGETTKGRVYLAAKAFGTHHGRSFSGRTKDGGVRIWRTN